MGKQVAARINLKTGYRCGDGEAGFEGSPDLITGFTSD